MPGDTPQQVTRTVDGEQVPVPGSWSIDPTHTAIHFEARHMMISKVRGSFANASGTIVVAEEILDSSVVVTIDTASIETSTADRDEHLRSADFFDVENHPEMTFQSTHVVSTGYGYRLRGDLTIRGVARPVDLDFEFTGGIVDPWGNARIAFSATTEVDREDWDLTWNMALEAGGFMVGKKLKIFIDTEAVMAS